MISNFKKCQRDSTNKPVGWRATTHAGRIPIPIAASLSPPISLQHASSLLPDGAESSADVPFDLHRKAFDGLAAPFAAFLDAEKKPDWILADIMHHWVATAAQDHGVPFAMLIPLAAGIGAMAGRPSMGSAAPTFEVEQAREQFTMDAEGALGMSMKSRFIHTLRSCPELEPDVFPLLTSLYGKPAVPLGLLPPAPDGASAASNNSEDDGAIIRWLDVQPDNSVVYVVLGSEAPLGVEQLHELALGLELAGTRFLWALRKPAGLHLDNGEVLLPEAFVERTRHRGLVAAWWVPQVSILAHPAVGAFLTHCGWSSVLEGLRFGRPLVMLPIVGEQGSNARLMESRKVGLQVPRNAKGGSFDRHGVAGAVRAVAMEEEGRVLAANANNLQEMVADRECHERYIDGFVQQLRSCNR